MPPAVPPHQSADTQSLDDGKEPAGPRPLPTASVTEVHNPNDQGAEEHVPHLHAKTFLAVFAVCLIYMTQLVALVGAGAQGQVIGGHFHDTAKVVWLSGPIAIFTVVLGPIVSQAADYWGRKWFLVILTFLGAVGSLIVARASTMEMAIAGFCVIGISFGTQPLLHVVTSEVLPRRWRGWAQAADMTSNSLGGIIGLYVGGALNRTSDPASNGFRYYYYMTMGIFLVAAALCAIVYNPPARETQKGLTHLQKLRELDWTGYALLAAGIVLFSFGLSYSKNPYPWSNPMVSATFGVGLFLLIALVLWEKFGLSDGMFHHGLFTGNRNFSITVFCVFCEGVAFFAANTYYAFEMSVLFEADALLVGLRYSIMMYVGALAACATGWYCAATRTVRWATVTGFIVFVAFFIFMATINREHSSPTFGYPAMLGTALGITLTTLVTIAQLSTPPELISVASGLIISVRSLGGTVALAIFNALFNDAISRAGQNIAKAAIPNGLDPKYLEAFIGGLVTHNNTALSGIPGLQPEVIQIGASALLNTYAVAFRNVWIAGACFVSLALIASMFLLDQSNEFNMHIDAPIEMDEDPHTRP